MLGLELTPDQHERLKALLVWTQTDISALGRTQGRQVLMLTALFDGVEGKVIASKLGAHPSMVSNFKGKVLSNGVEPLLEMWEASVQRYRAESEKHFGSRRAGAFDTTNKWLETYEPDNEPAIAIAQMVIGPGCNYVIFGVRHCKSESSESMPVLGDFRGKVRRILKKPIIKSPPWTRISTFDAHISEMFRCLAAKYPSLEMPEWNAEPPDPIPDLQNKFGSEYEFLIIAQGDVAERHVANWQRMAEARGSKLNPNNLLLVTAADEFFQQLESSVYRLRERWSCAGLFSDVLVVCELVRHWASSTESEPFTYSVDVQRFKNQFKRNSLLWRYPALYGGLFHMSPSMWSRLSHKWEFTLTVSKLRPNIVVKPVFDEEGGAMLFMSVEIIPHIGFTYMAARVLSSHESIRKIERGFRKQLREKGRSTTFSYSTNPLLVVRDFTTIGVEPDGATLPNLEKTYSVLVPRHFVVTDETLVVPLCGLHALAKRLKEGVSLESFTVEGASEPCLIFYAPSLLSGIRTAYEANMYGDLIYAMERQLRGVASHLGKEEADLWNRVPVAPISHLHPSYWCLDPATNGPENSGGPDAWRWKSFVNKLAYRLKIPPGEAPRTRPPPDSIERGFGNVLSDLDADFLYCHVLPEDRTVAERLADLWEEQVKELISSRYDVGTREGRNRVLASLGYELAKGVAGRKTELRSLVYDVLEEFAKNSRRVIRKAIEVLQRCSLDGLEPVPLVIETEKSLSKMFFRFLGQRSKSVLIQRTRTATSTNASRHDTIDGSCEVDYGEIDELVSLILSMMKQPRDRSLARSFAIEAVRTDLTILGEVVAELAKVKGGAEIKAAVLEGLKLCRGPKGETLSPEAKETALMDLFAAIPKQEQPPIKPR